MRRLIKKSTIDHSGFIVRHVQYNSSDKQEIEEVIAENDDCLYSGRVFRVLYFYKEDLKEEFLKFLESENEDKMDPKSYAHYYVNNVLDKMVRVNSQYQSFAKNISGVINVDDFFKPDKGPEDVSVIIVCQVSNGLDIEKFVNKHKDILNHQALDAYDMFSGQEEVLAKFDDPEFYCENVNEIHKLFKEFQGD